MDKVGRGDGGGWGRGEYGREMFVLFFFWRFSGIFVFFGYRLLLVSCVISFGMFFISVTIC